MNRVSVLNFFLFFCFFVFLFIYLYICLVRMPLKVFLCQIVNIDFKLLICNLACKVCFYGFKRTEKELECFLRIII